VFQSSRLTAQTTATPTALSTTRKRKKSLSSPLTAYIMETAQVMKKTAAP
jgi:hypothetical protein